MNKAYLQAISYYLPEEELTNERISAMHPEWSIEKISSKTGIKNRHIAKKGETAGDMAIEAANELFSEYQIDKNTIDYIILCTQSPDYFLPTTACIIQDKLGLSKKTGALDINLGCSGYIYGLGLAKGLVVSGQAKNIVLITSETYSKHIHPKDKSNKTIFGDAAAATLVSGEYYEGMLNAEIKEFNYSTDGGGYEKLIIKNGGFRNPEKGLAKDVFVDDTFNHNDDYLFMDGKGIFDFTSFEVPKLVTENLNTNSLRLEQVNLFVFHQANKFMVNFVRNRCKIPQEKFYIDMEDVGNTVSATIPIAFKRAIKKGVAENDSYVMLCGFGVGLSMGAVILFIP